jgi:hypothetical protein
MQSYPLLGVFTLETLKAKKEGKWCRGKRHLKVMLEAYFMTEQPRPVCSIGYLAEIETAPFPMFPGLSSTKSIISDGIFGILPLRVVHD